MALRINMNVAALNAHRQLQGTDNALGSSIEKLSSGFKINRAADSPSGLAISEGLRAQISGMGQAISNSNDAINMIKTAEGALGEVHSLLRTMRDLAVHASQTATNDEDAVAADQTQVDEIILALDRIADNTAFGNTKLLNGDASALVFQVGANEGETMTVAIDSMATGGIVLTDPLYGVGAVDVSSDAPAAITALDDAIKAVSTLRADLGAKMKSLESNMNSLGVAKENIAASESAIRDTDMAAEMVNFTRNQILMQAGVSMLAQANSAPQSLLKLMQ